MYILRAADGSAESRVGYSVDPDFRLRQHNREIAGGAEDTQGVIWKIYAVFSGFNGESHALSFEGAMQTPCNSVSHYSERIKVAESLMKITKYQFVQLDAQHYSIEGHLQLAQGSSTQGASSIQGASRVARTETKNNRSTPYL